MNKYYYCNSCGNMFEVLNDSGVNPVCCEDTMKVVEANTNESGSIEKHIPVVRRDGFLVDIEVGSTAHPMTREHYIEWIELVTDKGVYRRKLEPGDDPKITFVIGKDELVNYVYAYCNIHGLWMA